MATTSISRQAIAVPGELANNTRAKDCLTAHSDEVSDEIPFGVMVGLGSTRDGVLKLATATDVLAGISVHGHFAEQLGSELGAIGVKPDVAFNILNKGAAYVTVEENVTPASRVFVRAIATTGETAGAFRATVDTDALVVADFTFTATNATETLTATAHGLRTGDGPVRLTTSDTLPAGLSLATDYYIIRLTANTFRLATTRANSLTGTYVLISDDGTGTHTVSDTVTTARVATIEVTDFCRYMTSASSGGLAVVDITMRTSRASDTVVV